MQISIVMSDFLPVSKSKATMASKTTKIQPPIKKIMINTILPKSVE